MSYNEFINDKESNSLYSKKTEQTCMYEHEDLLDDFFRSTLKNRTVESASLAQDMPRESQKQFRSDVLNIRNGARSTHEPNHPDLFTGFTERDSRGYHNSGPDIKQHKEHSTIRAKYTDILPDHLSDRSTPTGEKSVFQTMKGLRSTTNLIQDRFKIFDTARDNIANPWAGSNATHVSTVSKNTMDGVIPSINNSEGMTNNKLTKTGNTQIGWKQLGDHRLKIAKYGSNTKKKLNADIRKSQANGESSQKAVETPADIKNRLSVSIMTELSRARNVRKIRSETDFNESIHLKNKIGKLMANLTTTQNSAKHSAAIVDLAYTATPVKQLTTFDSKFVHNSAIVDKGIYKQIQEAKNTTIVRKTDQLARRKVLTNDGKAPIVTDNIMIYSRLMPKIIKQLPVKTEHKWSKSDNTLNRAVNHTNYSVIQSDYTDVDHSITPYSDATFDKTSKTAGHHQNARILIDNNYNDDTSMETFTRSARGR